jgi:hypothetical protein
MKKYFSMIVFVTLASVLCYGQDDTTRNLTLKKQADSSVVNAEGETRFQMQDLEEVSADKLPEAVKKTLAAGNDYKGWEKNTVYYDSQHQLYVLELKEGITTRVFRFNKEGKPVTGMLNEENEDQ